MKKYDLLRDALVHLYEHGRTNDFTRLGIPTVRAVNRHYRGIATRQQIDDGWYELYGCSTYRPNGHGRFA